MTDEAVRRVLHCDMDCFYAAIHMRDDPALRGLPVAVGGSPTGRGVVAAASYEIRRYGVHSAMPAARALALCPQAVFIRPDFTRYKAESQAIFAIFREFTPLVEPGSLDEAYLDVSDHLGRFETATALAREIRRRVREERQLTVSVGVGPNRLIAKIASDFKKPDGLTVVPPPKVQAFLDPLPVRRLHGVGPATERVLHELGIRVVAELRAQPLAVLEERFGSWGESLWRYCRGIDERPVVTEHERKSLGSEETFAEDLTTLEQMDGELEALAEQVASGLERRGLLARTISVKVRYSDFTTLTRALTIDRPTASARTILLLSQQLLRMTDAGKRRVRLLGVTASGLTSGEDLQLWLFDEAELPPQPRIART